MPKLETREISMQFPGVRALDGVSLEFAQGEVHGIIGENGAGKSTLMKILSGVQAPTSGTLLLEGSPVAFRGVRQAQSAGIAMIHQELNLVGELTAAENIFLGREKTRGGLIDRESMNREAAEALKLVRASFEPTAQAGDLTIAGQQLIEIAKAAAAGASILIMDEPTAVLSEPESEALFALIERLKAQGTTVLYISHRLDEVCRICDRISVLRDGKWVTTIPAAGADPGQLADLMVGRPFSDFFPEKAPVPTGNAPILEVRDARGPLLSIRPGEVVGMAGLVGAGRTELAEAVMALRAWPGLAVRVEGRDVSINSPRAAHKLGLAYLSEDRKLRGLHMSLSITQNITLAHLRAFGSVFVNQKRESEAAAGWQTELDLRAASLEMPARSLSGGNQQKVSAAKQLEMRPRILILDEPTRGVDVGAKRELYALIQKLASEGMACLVISSDLPEIIGLCHRALVMREGRIVGEMSESEMSEEGLIRLAAGVGAA